jgi:hypothetical protein
MCRKPASADHGPDHDRVFAETVAEITRLTEQARKRGRPEGTTGIPRTGDKTREQLAARVRKHQESSARLQHAIELREMMERSREEKARRTRVFLIGQAVYAQMEVDPVLADGVTRMLDHFYTQDKPRQLLGLPRLSAEEKRQRKSRR